MEAVKAKPLPRESVRFSRREVRGWTGQSDTQARIHLERLVGLEYLLTHRGRRGQSFEYELVYDGDGSDATHLAGLLDTTAIRSSRGEDVAFAGATRPQGGPIPACFALANLLDDYVLLSRRRWKPSPASDSILTRRASWNSPPSVVPSASCSGCRSIWMVLKDHARSRRGPLRAISQRLTELPIALWDERLSTAAVERALIAADASRAKRKAVIDQHAAAYILQGALDRLARLADG